MTSTSNYFLDTADALELITRFNEAPDEQTIVTLLRTLSQQMGFDHFRLGFIFPSSIQRPDVRIFNGCPAEWVLAYDKQRFFAVDPVVRKGMKQSTQSSGPT